MPPLGGFIRSERELPVLVPRPMAAVCPLFLFEVLLPEGISFALDEQQEFGCPCFAVTHA